MQQRFCTLRFRLFVRKGQKGTTATENAAVPFSRFYSSSSGGRAAVYDQCGSGDKCGGIGCQIQHGRGNFLRLRHPVHGDFVQQGFRKSLVLQQSLIDGGCGKTRANGVDGDAVFCPFSAMVRTSVTNAPLEAP